MFVFNFDGQAILSPKIDAFEGKEPFEVNSIPEGDGVLMTDGKTLWWEPNPKATPTLEESFESLQAENKLLKAQIQAQTERADFVEDCMAEMAMLVYQ